MRHETTDIAVGMLGLLPVLMILLGGIGWIMNIVKIVWAIQANDLTAMFVARVVGAFIVPVGAVLGFF
jgi:hypothetical protein